MQTLLCHQGHKCSHGKEFPKTEPKLLSAEDVKNFSSGFNERIMQEGEALNILFYTGLIDGNPKLKPFLEEIIIPKLKNYLGSFLKPASPRRTVPITTPTDMCGVITSEVPIVLDLDIDLLIFVMDYEDKESSTLAMAMPCIYNNLPHGPEVGFVWINESQLTYDTLAIENFYYILLHELGHVFAFHSHLYPLFKPETTFTEETKVYNGVSKQVWKMSGPKTIEVAREHFGCATIDGIYMEHFTRVYEDGSEEVVPGAHFEKLHFGNEMMISHITGFIVTSPFFLAFLDDSGFYEVDHSKAEKFHYGKNAGCGFLENTNCSVTASEYCAFEGMRNCSENYHTKTFCAGSTYSDECLVRETVSVYDCTRGFDRYFINTQEYEEIGQQSRCFETDGDSGCFISECNETDTVVRVTVNGVSYDCDSDGKTIDIVDGGVLIFTLTCPNIQDFCLGYHDECPNSCSGKGRCLEDGTCRCFSFYGGDDCSLEIDCTAWEGADLDLCYLVNTVGHVSGFNYWKGVLCRNCSESNHCIRINYDWYNVECENISFTNMEDNGLNLSLNSDAGLNSPLLIKD